MKKNNKGFMLAETLIVTTFVAGVLIYMFIQFTNLNQNYDESYKYNTVEGIYALEDLSDFILNNSLVINNIDVLLPSEKYTDISKCDEEVVINSEYCKNLVEALNIEKAYVTTNKFSNTVKDNLKDEFGNFINKIKGEGSEKYRLIAKFKDGTFATIRFGE